MTGKRMGYRAAVAWIVDNDDTEFLDEGDPASVTAVFLADLFGFDVDRVVADLRRYKTIKKHFAQNQEGN